MNTIIQDRLSRLRLLLNSDSEAALITSEINIGYFSGFFHSEGTMLVTREKAFLFVDFRYIEAAQKYAECCEVICFKKLVDELIEVCKNQRINSLYTEACDLSVSRYNLLKEKFGIADILLNASSKLDDKINDIRIIKGNSELENIIKAQRITEEAYLEVLNYIKPGVSERSIAVELEYIMKKKGAEQVSFDLITITGKKTSLPHGVPGDDLICEGDFFTMDIGSTYNGYHSDMTRTVAVKSATDKMKFVYDIVLKAQLAALDVIKEGVLCSEVDKTARDIIDKAGFGKYFGHATGHGVGLEIHEAPAVSLKSDITLKSGMIITDEPGIYLPNEFGVRIEDMVFVTGNACKNLVTLPKELIIL